MTAEMTTASAWPWAVLVLLGAAHGLNPGMGWLFAVALGLQERRRGAVWNALLPLAAGHAVAIAAAALVAAVVGLVVPAAGLRWLVAAALLGLGLARLRRHRHPRWAGMRVGGRELTGWSFLMASAHGAGLMAVPFILRATPHPLVGAGHHAGHAMALAAAVPPGAAVGLAATLAHTAGYLGVTMLVAVVVYERLGLRLLRTAWINLDLVWALALTCTAVVTMLV